MAGEIDYHLRRQVDQVSSQVVQLAEHVGQVSGQVSAVDTAQRQTRADLQTLVDEFRAFAHQAGLAVKAQRAETRVGVVQDRLEHEFGHHKVVRRTAVGILQAFDVGLVSEETVRQISEQLMIQTPRYWLAPALVALAAWAQDDRELCDRAVEEAFRRSPARTSLFFALILRRQGRRDSAARWLRHYLGAQDPTALGREFAVILECVSQGAFGPVGRELLRNTLDGWQQTLLTDDAVRDAQVRRWWAETESLRGAPSTRFPRLAAVSPQWAQLDGALRSAAVHQKLLDKYTALMSQETRPSDRLEDTVDDILDRLVKEYDNEELPLRRDLAFNEAVIAHGGDEDAARRAVDVDAASLEEKLDYLTVQSTAALNPAAIGASAATQRLSVAACHEWFTQAHAGFSRDYRAAVPSDVQVTFIEPNGLQVGGKHFRMRPWTGSFNLPLEQLERSLNEHWNKSAERFVDSLAYPINKQLWALVGTVTAILLLFVGVNVGFAFIAAIIVGGIWGFTLYNRTEAGRKAQEAAKQLLDRHKRESVLQLRGASAELTDWQRSYNAADALEARAREFLASLATAGTAGTPFEGRVAGTNEGTS